MTGYRIGFVAAPQPVAAAVGRLHSQLTGSPNAISQAAYLAALQQEPPEVAAMCAEFQKRRNILVRGLESIGLRTPQPRGAFYAFPEVSKFLDARGSKGFCEDLLEQQNLAVVPGSAFELEGYIRLSYATSIAQIEAALERLGRFVATHPRRG
jgi:aminotransferase